MAALGGFKVPDFFPLRISPTPETSAKPHMSLEKAVHEREVLHERLDHVQKLAIKNHNEY
jgi:hypothetical protein